MKVTIAGREYDFEMNGTVGHVYYAESVLLKGEKWDALNMFHQMAFAYSVLRTCNKEVPTFERFYASLTGKSLEGVIAYMNERWLALEGETEEAPKTEAEGKNV
ncbi:MAG: hypothetical protein LUD72_07145 [Bacteroidales bacterium]|nr:hypothetical protein [Bacteroidales bacterium]